MAKSPTSKIFNGLVFFHLLPNKFKIIVYNISKSMYWDISIIFSMISVMRDLDDLNKNKGRILNNNCYQDVDELLGVFGNNIN